MRKNKKKPANKKRITPREKINNFLEELMIEDGEVVLMDGFDEAFIGVSQRVSEPLVAVYSQKMMVDVLIKRDKMTFDDAYEFISFNCQGAYIGPKTPIIVSEIKK